MFCILLVSLIYKAISLIYQQQRIMYDFVYFVRTGHATRRIYGRSIATERA